jgi:flagellar protein FliL
MACAALAIAVVGVWLSNACAAQRPALAVGEAKGTLHLETFVINLDDPDHRSYLRIGIDLGLGRELARNENPPVAEVRDAVLGVLSESHADELLTPEGKAKLKQQLLHTLEERVPSLGIEEVYFTEFLIQR